MRRAGVRTGSLVFGAGRRAFAKFFQLDAQPRKFLVQGQHGLVLLRDVAFEPGEALLEVYPLTCPS
jgi:hypothetical protein